MRKSSVYTACASTIDVGLHKSYMIYKLTVFVTLVFVSACTSRLDQNHNSLRQTMEFVETGVNALPEFIGGIDYSFPENFYIPNVQFCVNLDARALWEPGDVSSKTDEHTASHTMVYVDGERVQQDNLHFVFWGTENYVYDDSGNLLGSHGGIIKVCVSSDIKTGQHLARLETSRTNGVVESYTWVFDLNR